jgi:hypothetical protein
MRQVHDAMRQLDQEVEMSSRPKPKKPSDAPRLKPDEPAAEPPEAPKAEPPSAGKTDSSDQI